jgi:hypothetical protein
MAVLKEGPLLAPPSTARQAVIYSGDTYNWVEVASHDLGPDGSSNLISFRRRMNRLAEMASITGCTIVVGADEAGASYGILGKLGLLICRLSSSEAESLENISLRVRELVKSLVHSQAVDCGLASSNSKRASPPDYSIIT